MSDALLDSDFGLRRVLEGIRATTEAGKRLFRRRLFKLLLKEGVVVVEPQLLRDLRHLSDYVRHCEERGEEERVESLIGMPSFDRMLATAEEYFARLRDSVQPDLDSTSLTVVAELADGFRIVELATQSQLETEGKLMQHCVGSYYEAVAAGNCRILSLRDPRNEPHCTMEVVVSEITQFQGKQNRAPAPRYRPYLKEFLLKSDLRAEPWMLKEVGLLRVGDQIYDYDNLPGALDIEGSLSFSMLSLSRLPTSIHVAGDLSLKYAQLPELPEDLVVGGDLLLNDSNVRGLPRGIEVRGRLVVEGVPGLHLPDPFEVEGDLVINDTSIELPTSLRVGGSLHLQRSHLKKLPEKLWVGGNLNLRESAVELLPAGLEVVGDLDLSGSAVTGLPQGLVVGGTLSCAELPIQTLPEDLVVGESLAAQWTLLRSVPAGIRIGGRLVLSSTPLSRLPRRLVVGSYLDLTDTRIVELPADMKAYGVILDNQEMSVSESRVWLSKA